MSLDLENTLPTRTDLGPTQDSEIGVVNGRGVDELESAANPRSGVADDRRRTVPLSVLAVLGPRGRLTACVVRCASRRLIKVRPRQSYNHDEDRAGGRPLSRDLDRCLDPLHHRCPQVDLDIR